jgi:hypothetical protein
MSRRPRSAGAGVDGENQSAPRGPGGRAIIETKLDRGLMYQRYLLPSAMARAAAAITTHGAAESSPPDALEDRVDAPLSVRGAPGAADEQVPRSCRQKNARMTLPTLPHADEPGLVGQRSPPTAKHVVRIAAAPGCRLRSGLLRAAGRSLEPHQQASQQFLELVAIGGAQMCD